MGAIMNGLLVHGGLDFYRYLPNISNYEASIRLSALMNLPAIYVFTHDSVAVEDGPPTSQLAGYEP